jgi:TatA/E family protein of Tat protein translocase
MMNEFHILAIMGLGTPEIIAIFILILILFGSKKLPMFARSLGRSLHEFKRAKDDFENEIVNAAKEEPTQPKSLEPTNPKSLEGVTNYDENHSPRG